MRRPWRRRRGARSSSRGSARRWSGRPRACPSSARRWPPRAWARTRCAASRISRGCPFTRKDHLREQYPWGLFAVPRHELARIHASSGTKGKPTVVGYTRNDLAIWREVMARSLAAGGAEPGHLIQIAYGYGLFTGGLGFHDGAEHMGLTVVPVSSGNTLRQMLLLQDFRPDGLACTPSFALHIGEALREAGQDPRALGLRYGLFGAEPWTEAMRGQLEALWGAAASDFYGLSELIGPGVAGECAAHDGLHINDDHFLPEIVDPGHRRPAGAGQGRRARPHRAHPRGAADAALPDRRSHEPQSRALRLRAHDRAHGAREGTHRRHGRHQGRERVPLAGGGGAVDDRGAGPALSAGGGPHPGVPQPRRPRGARRGRRGRPGVASTRAGPQVVALAARVGERLRGHLGLNPEIAIVPPRTIPRSEGKAVRVVERR